jgi:hypothetical protein
MASYSNASTDLYCVSGDPVYVGNVLLTDMSAAGEEATNLLSIDVIASDNKLNMFFHFITLVMQIESPANAYFVDHTTRPNFRWEVLADPTVDPFVEPNVSKIYWVEKVVPTPILRIREDKNTLLSGSNNGRSFHIGIAGINTGEALRFKAWASASEDRVESCRLQIDLEVGQSLPGYLR